MGMQKTVAADISISDVAENWKEQKVAPPEGETKLFQTVTFSTGTFDDDSRTFTAIASTPIVDRGGDTIDQTGWELGNFIKNPVIPWAHDYWQPPVGRAVEIGINPKGYLQFTYQAPPEGVYPFADTIWNLYRNQFMFAFSVGFMPIEQSGDWQSGHNFSKMELLEISAVVVPANPQALTLAYKMGIIDVPHLKTMKEKIMATAKNIDDVLAKASKKAKDDQGEGTAATTTDGAAASDAGTEAAAEVQPKPTDENNAAVDAEVVTPPTVVPAEDQPTTVVADKPVDAEVAEGEKPKDPTAGADEAKGLTTTSDVRDNTAMEAKAGAQISSANRDKLKGVLSDLQKERDRWEGHCNTLSAMIGESGDEAEADKAGAASKIKSTGEQETAASGTGEGEVNASTTTVDAGADHKDVTEDEDEFVDPDNLTPEQSAKVQAALDEVREGLEKE